MWSNSISQHARHGVWVPASAGTTPMLLPRPPLTVSNTSLNAATQHMAHLVRTTAIQQFRSCASERGVASIDHETVGRVIRGCLAHEIHRDAAEIAGLAEPAHGDSRHHIGHELLVAHDAGGHVALDPAGQDGIGSDALAG